MSEANRRPVHREYDGNLETNMPQWAQIKVDCLFIADPKNDWTHSGMAYAFAEKMGVNDLEEFVYCLNDEIKRRKVDNIIPLSKMKAWKIPEGTISKGSEQ